MCLTFPCASVWGGAQGNPRATVMQSPTRSMPFDRPLLQATTRLFKSTDDDWVSSDYAFACAANAPFSGAPPAAPPLQGLVRRHLACAARTLLPSFVTRLHLRKTIPWPRDWP